MVRYSVAAILVSFVGAVCIFMWMVLMSLGGGGRSKPSILYLPPWMFPVTLMVAAVFLLVLHWIEVAGAEEDRLSAERSDFGPFSLAGERPGPRLSRFKLARSGFRYALPARHKAHTIASHALTLVMAGLLMYVGVLLLRIWLRE